MAAPTIASIVPDIGSTAGGTVVTVRGTDLGALLAASLGGTALTVTVISAAQITFPTPSHAIGAVNLVLRNADGTVTATGGYRYSAPPTVSAVTPASGNTRGGNMVVITGTNFLLPAPPVAAGYLGGAAPRTVKVSFEGVEAPWAEAASATSIYATVPEWRGTTPQTWPLALDVRVANLNTNGSERTGEVATRVDGYALTRLELARECYLQRVVRELLRLLKRHVADNVGIALGRDYDDDTTDWARLRATAPCLTLAGPTSELNRFYSLNMEPDEEDPLDAARWLRRRPPVTVDLGFTVRGYAHAMEHLYAMGQALLLTFRDIVRLRVLRDPANEAAGFVEYEVEVAWEAHPGFTSAPSVDDLFYFDARLLIRGVHLDDESGTVIRRGWIVSTNAGEPTVDTQAL